MFYFALPPIQVRKITTFADGLHIPVQKLMGQFFWMSELDLDLVIMPHDDVLQQLRIKLPYSFASNFYDYLEALRWAATEIECGFYFQSSPVELPKPEEFALHRFSPHLLDPTPRPDAGPFPAIRYKVYTKVVTDLFCLVGKRGRLEFKND